MAKKSNEKKKKHLMICIIVVEQMRLNWTFINEQGISPQMIKYRYKNNKFHFTFT